jgi:hypothetical protein
MGQETERIEKPMAIDLTISEPQPWKSLLHPTETPDYLPIGPAGSSWEKYVSKKEYEAKDYDGRKFYQSKQYDFRWSFLDALF